MAARSRPLSRITQAPAGATDPTKDAALIEDGITGKVLYARNETALRHPASLTKMMTLYLLFEALRAHHVSMETQMPVSAHASVQKPTKLSLRPGQTINVDTAIRAIVIRSANDVAVVIAEALGGTESHFAVMMTEKARQLGMKDTNYHNASGLPDALQITTATDLAILARHLAYDFPQYFPYFGTAGFTYKGVYYPTHDNLIGRYQGADGIKTGYTGASGFNLATSVTREGVHLIAIVMGGRTAIRRDLEMMHLLDTEFAQIDANPALVARATPPWRNLASATPPANPEPTLPLSAEQFAALSATPAMAAPSPAGSPSDDEDTAESRRAPDENYSIIHAEAPALASVAQPPQPATLPAVPAVPAIKPAPAQPMPARQASTQPAQIAALAPKPTATAVVSPALRSSSAGEGDVDQTGSAPGRNWTIQVGAFADSTLAKAQLEAFAKKAQDVVGQAVRIVAPLTSANGHTIYRARFGLYAEQEARAVCDKLTQRGQTCFAVATR
jgi:D-alanyl-D-alanine carboxypeptidase